ncbi:hypothetical protein RSOLAG1IB_06746 [Rhizoctonia solani AG-1 IB]|uniref:Uncharacterized protein n=1 Tax=Thanatephorus cucumeris (strain AG1-IB / isolate 7/3/14) TaxID=1108050 RepID=A0A0B7FCP9_THACB|nr:hypothetical protein RSOLAG1IB_06746 [Rhizoctonia solani AG-1 IB]
MENLGKPGEGITPIGITQPFPLLSQKGVLALREEIFSQEVLNRCTYTSDLTPCLVRGMSCRPGLAPFNKSLWTHPETLRAVSEAAGIELVPIMPYELGHVNVQLTDGVNTLSKLGREPLRAGAPSVHRESVVPKIIPGVNNLPPLVSSASSDTESEGEVDLPYTFQPQDQEVEPTIVESMTSAEQEQEPEEDEHKPVVGWHRDSYPWVCVVMLSDATTMEGGETALGCGDGTVRKVRGPEMGWAIMLQGRYIDHVALGAYGAPERVTMVTSYRAKDVMLKDESILTTIRPVTNLNELYYEWSTYRLDLLSERFKKKSDIFKRKRGDGQTPWGEEVVNKDEFKAWCKEQIKYLQTTIDEIV